MRPVPRFRMLLLLPVLLHAGVAGGRAQERPVLEGRVIDLEGKPVAGQEVLLHRVAGQEGARVGQVSTDAAGVFRFTIEEEASDETVFFATARHDGQVYVGPFVRLPIDRDLAYEVVVGGEPVSFEAPTMPAESGTGVEVRPPASPRRWALALIPLVGVLGAGVAVVFARKGRSDRRDLLIRLATIEEELAASGGNDRLREERRRILEQLSGGLGS